MFPPPRRVSPYRLSMFVFLFLLLVGQAWAGRAKTKAESADAVVAIGDVHGAFDDFVAILQRSGLIDIGPDHRDWLFSKSLFTTRPAEIEVRDFILKQMGA